MTKMNPEIKEKWLTALRSGDYKQGRGALRKIGSGEDTYCCLGVLCDIYSREKGVEWVARRGLGTMEGSPSILPREVMVWSGVSTETGLYGNGRYGQDELTAVNDYNDNFDRVIEIIEEYF